MLTSQLHDAIVQACDDKTSCSSTDSLAFTITHMLADMEQPEEGQHKPVVNCVELRPDTDRGLVRDSLCEMTWTLVVSQSPNVRVFAGVILNILAASG